MIDPNLIFKDFDKNTKEGKLLLAAISILTQSEDIDENKFRGMSTPDKVLQKIAHISNLVYHEDEYRSYLNIKKRDEKINNILK